MGKLDRICDIGIEVCILAVLLVTPGLWNAGGLSAYELPKVCFLRVMVVAGLALWGMKRFGVVGSRFWVQEGNDEQVLRIGCPRPVRMAVLAFVGVQVVSCLLSQHRYTSFFGTLDRQQGCYTMLCYVGFFFLLWSHLGACGFDSPRVRRALVAVVLGSVWVCAHGLGDEMEFVRKPETGAKYPPGATLPWERRMSSTFGNAIFLGAYLILVIPLTAERVWRLGQGTSWASRVGGCAGALLLGAQLICLFLTGSRGPWVGLAAAAVFLAVVMGLRLRARRFIGVAGAVVLVLAALFVVMNTENALRPALARVPYLGRFGFVDEMRRGEGQGRVRPLVWKATVQMLSHPPSVGLEPDKLRVIRPWVGWGQDMMLFTFQAVFPPRLEDHGPGRRLDVDRAHNVFLDVAVATGLVGLAAYVSVLAAGFWVGLRRLWGTEDRAEQLLLAFALAALFGHVVEAQFGIVLTAAQTLVWLALALIATSRVREARHDPAPQQRWFRLVWAAVLGAAVVFAAAAHARSQMAADTLMGTTWALGLPERSRVERIDRAIRLAPWESRYRYLAARECFVLAQGTPPGPFKAKLLEEGAAAVEAAIGLQPFYANCYAAAGRLYEHWARTMDSSKLSQAILWYEQALRLSPNNVDMRDDLAWLLADFGRYKEALGQLERSAAIDPGYKRTQDLLGKAREKLSGHQPGR